jgi:hypothetical protein
MPALGNARISPSLASPGILAPPAPMMAKREATPGDVMRQGLLSLLVLMLGCPVVLAQEGTAPADRWYVGGEFLWWYLRQERVPPLLTTGPAASQGILGQPGTQILYGDEKIKSRHDRFIGFRGTVGLWLDEEQTWAAEVRAFILERDSSNFTIKPTGQFLARPYINATTGQHASEIISGQLPNGDALLGSFNAYSRIEMFGQEANLVGLLWEDEAVRLEGLAGGRFLQLRHRLDLTSSGKTLPDLSIHYGVRDHFQTFNKFFGVQLGLRGGLEWNGFFLRAGGTVAVGGTDEEIRTKAQRVTHTPMVREEQPLGLYVLPTNTGRYQRVVIDVVSEAQVMLGYKLTEHWRVMFGYTFLHWLNPVRSGGDQIDAIDPGQITGSSLVARPVMPFKDDFFWAQGMSVGMEIVW